MAVAAAVAAGLGLASKVYGGIQSYRNQRKMEGQLRDLQKNPIAKFSVDPKVRGLYEQSIAEASKPEGYGGATVSGFRQGIGRNIRGRFRNAMSISGGSGSRGVNAVLNSQGLDAYNQFAQGDENLRRTNRNMALNRSQGYANQFQNVKDRNTQFDQNYRLQTERALGEGIRSQRDYRTNMITGAGSDLLTGAIGYGDLFGGGGQGSEVGSEMGSMSVGGPNTNLLTPRARYMAGRNPFRENAPNDILTYDQPLRINRGSQSRFMYGN